MFFDNTSPGGTFSTSFIPQNFTGHNQFRNNTGPGLRVGYITHPLMCACLYSSLCVVGLLLDGLDCSLMGWTVAGWAGGLRVLALRLQCRVISHSLVTMQRAMRVGQSISRPLDSSNFIATHISTLWRMLAGIYTYKIMYSS